MSPVCECGHLDVPTHGDDGDEGCRMHGCSCERFRSEDEEVDVDGV